MRIANISAIYKGKGEVSDLESDRGIFLVSVFRTIMMIMIYQDKYNIIDRSMSTPTSEQEKIKISGTTSS